MTSFKIISLLFIPSKNPMSSKISQNYSKDQTMLMAPTPQTCISKLILNLINGSKSGHEIKSPRSLFFILTGNLTDCHHVYKSVFQSFAFSFTWIHLRQETRLTNITDTHIIVTPKKKTNGRITSTDSAGGGRSIFTPRGISVLWSSSLQCCNNRNNACRPPIAIFFFYI